MIQKQQLNIMRKEVIDKKFNSIELRTLNCELLTELSELSEQK